MKDKLFKIRDKTTGLFLSGGSLAWKFTTKGKTWAREYDAKNAREKITKDISFSRLTKANPEDIEVVEYKMVFSRVCD